MIRVVLDTNIVLSAFLWGGPPRQVLGMARLHLVTIVATQDVLDELRDVLSRPKFAERIAEIGRIWEQIYEDYRVQVEIVQPAIMEPVIVADPKDDKIIACAIGGKVDYIVSGDRHLIALGSFANIPIWNAMQLLTHIKGFRAK